MQEMRLRPGQNPREVLSNHAERGPKRFNLEFTYSDLAGLLGMSEGSLRLAVHRGRFDPSNLESVVEFVAERRAILAERTPHRS